MKKRIVCALLTLIMLVSLVPVTTMTASAATLKTSEAAITIMKKLAKFSAECYQVTGTNQYLIGYGTVCSEKHNVEYVPEETKGDDSGTETKSTINDKTSPKHNITEAQASAALKKVVLSLDEKVNSFASANGLTLSQCQHDALVLFTFNEGDSWMSGSGVVKSAIVSNASTNDLLKAMSDWAGSSNDLNRRKIEVNMYKNGIYSDVVPSSFGTVTYDADGGILKQSSASNASGASTYQMIFDTTKTASHIAAPTRSGYKFMGWYTAKSGGQLVLSLTGSCNGKTLYAGWQPNSVNASANTDTIVKNMHVIDETLKLSQLATKDVYDKPSKKEGKVIETLDSKTTTEIDVDRDFIDESGNRWCKKVGGPEWVLLGASTNSDSGYTGGKLDVTVTVTNSYVNKRANASASSKQLGSYTAGTKLKIIAVNDAKTWGQVEENGVAVCWIALMYTDFGSVYDGSSPSDANNTTPIATATVTYNGYLNARSDPGVDNKIVGGFGKNTTVNLFEIRTVNGHRWGRTSSGWICLTYTKVTMLTDKAISDQGALDYAFTGKIVGGKADFYTEPTSLSSKTGDQLEEGASVTITNLAYNETEAGTAKRTWGKANWTVTETKDGKTTKTAKSGWIPMDGGIISDTSASVLPRVKIDPVKFTVVSDTLNIRQNADSGSDLVFKLTKGVEVEVQEIKLVNEEIWGKIKGYTAPAATKDDKADDSKEKSPSSSTSTVKETDGWINLASNYVKRSSKITIEGSTKDAIGTGTVVNADSVRVRMTSAIYGTVLGSINRGTKVAVLGEKDGWYKIDFDVDNNPETDSWIYGQYLEVKMGVVDSDTSNSGSSDTAKTNGTGTGIIANTYSGVNVRSGAGIGNAVVGKLLNGTQVEVLEVKTVGTAKWGRVKQGWICMDYVTMISYSDIPGNSTGSDTSKGTAVDSFDNAEKTTTTAVYTGKVNPVGGNPVTVYKTPNPNLTEADNKVRSISSGENITVHELMVVTMEIYEGNKTEGTDKDVETVVKQTSYWARINDGWIKDPDTNISLNALDEKIHTVTGATTLGVWENEGAGGKQLTTLKKGDQVPVTKLEICKDSGAKKLSVWGRVETSDGFVGYCDLSCMSEGALYEKKEEATKPTTPSTPTIGSTGNTGDGGFVNNTSGYKYTGKVINTTSLNVRATPSTGARVATTLKGGASLVIYETKIAENMAWGRCDAGWVYLYYVDMTPASGSAIDARVVYNDNTIIYTDNDASSVAGTYSRMSVIDIYEYVGDMARTDLGWVSTGNLL